MHKWYKTKVKYNQAFMIIEIIDEANLDIWYIRDIWFLFCDFTQSLYFICVRWDVINSFE